MTCNIDRPSQQVLFQRVKDMFSSTVLGGGAVLPESNEWYAVGLNYAMAEEFYAVSEQQWRENDPRYACCDNLYAIAERDGVYPNPAAFAQGYIQLTGEPGAALQQDIEFQFGGQMYAPISTVPAAIPAGGSVVIRVAAIEPGPDGNIPAQLPNGVMITPLPGVNSAVTVFGHFCGGDVAETCEQFRSRYLDRMRYQPSTGLAYVKQKLMEWPCVTRVCERVGSCCDEGTIPPWRAGIDCNRPINLYAIFDNTFPCGMAPQTVVDEITTWLFGQVQGIGQGVAEWGMTGRVFTAEPVLVNVTVGGLACSSPAQAAEAEARIRDYVGELCPSLPLNIDDLKVIVAQVMGSAGRFQVQIKLDNEADKQKVAIDRCGNAVPQCDYRVCLNRVIFAGGGRR